MTTTPTTSTAALSFRDKLEARCKDVDSLLCIGLDPHFKELFPDVADPNTVSSEDKCSAAYTFCRSLVSATESVAVCYKPNAAFFEALGDGGIEVLRRIVKDVIPSSIPVLLDVKRGDIGSTAQAYAVACYDYVGADAVTLSPLMGWDSVSPFVTDEYSSKGAFLLCKTSNPGSNDLLALPLSAGELMYERIASLVSTTWPKMAMESGSQASPFLGLVVGATDPEALARAREAAGEDVWILAPGVGFQGGSLHEAAKAGLNTAGTNMLVPVSRGISRADDPVKAAKELNDQIQAVRKEVLQGKASTSTSSGDAGKILPFQRQFVEFSLDLGVLKFGSFTLKSGRTSPYFFNAGLFCTGQALFKLAQAYASSILASDALMDGPGKAKFDVIFGPAYKGISLAALVASCLFQEGGIDVGYAYNRKEAKDHGEGGLLVGASMRDGKRVLIVDDVITAGTAIRESVTLLNQVGAQPMGVAIALDRAEVRSEEDRISAVQAVERDLQLPVVSIVSLPQLQSFLEQQKPGDKHYFGEDIMQSVVAYRKQYGV